MVGAVIIAHSLIGNELIAAAQYILGKIEGITAVSVDFETNAFEARKIISKAIKEVDEGDGVLLLTDLFGGSPCNIAFSFLNNEKVEVVTGLNLPMILTFWNKRSNNTLQETAKHVQLSGTRSIVRAKALMEAKGAIEERTPPKDRRLSQK
ncbi:MAG: PTS sugar transporter subunit IIA [Thermodesulfobacteriota bacterium]